MISSDNLGTIVVRYLNSGTSKQSVPSFASDNSVCRKVSLALKLLHCIEGCRAENAVKYDRLRTQTPRVQQFLELPHIFPFRSVF